jgi:hypothetical protein
MVMVSMGGTTTNGRWGVYPRSEGIPP